jgi:putative transposase
MRSGSTGSTAKRKKRTPQLRVLLAPATQPNQRWSMDFVSERLAAGRWFRILTVVDQYTRECLCAHADRPQTGEKVVEQMERLAMQRGYVQDRIMRRKSSGATRGRCVMLGTCA